MSFVLYRLIIGESRFGGAFCGSAAESFVRKIPEQQTWQAQLAACKTLASSPAAPDRSIAIPFGLTRGAARFDACGALALRPCAQKGQRLCGRQLKPGRGAAAPDGPRLRASPAVAAARPRRLGRGRAAPRKGQPRPGSPSGRRSSRARARAAARWSTPARRRRARRKGRTSNRPRPKKQ